MTYRVVILPGDGVGPEVVSAAVQVLDAIAGQAHLDIQYAEITVGGAAIDAYGTPLRDEDLETCRGADAVLLGAVGGPRWDDLPIEHRPERALLRLRSELALPINLRPVQWTRAGAERSPLKPEVAQGADIAFVRELTGGVYFGRPSFVERREIGRYAVDTAEYSEQQIVDVLDFAFELAGGRRGKVTSVDKANIMHTSRLWREVATEYGKKHPDIELEHALVDSFAMSLMQDPRRYDVVVTENLFGDILTDLASVLAGSLGVLPSASLQARRGVTQGVPDTPSIPARDTPPTQGHPERRRFGLYEPVHGSAPTIAGQNVANPIACILSVALMLEWSFARPDLAAMLRGAIATVMDQGHLTADLAGGGAGESQTRSAVSTTAFINVLLNTLDEMGGARGRRDLRHHVA